MPLYDYACTKCGRICEVRHGFDESYREPCAACGAPVRRVFNPAPVLFKGSGFYVTDSRRSSASGKSEKPKDDASTASAGSEAKSSDSKSAKPSDSAA
jgi:putative FmdB family regulatory protein